MHCNRCWGICWGIVAVILWGLTGCATSHLPVDDAGGVAPSWVRGQVSALSAQGKGKNGQYGTSVPGYRAFVGRSGGDDISKNRQHALDDALQQIRWYTGVQVHLDVHQQTLQGIDQYNGSYALQDIPPIIIGSWYEHHRPQGGKDVFVQVLAKTSHLDTLIAKSGKQQEFALVNMSQDLLLQHQRKQAALAQFNWYQGELVVKKETLVPIDVPIDHQGSLSVQNATVQRAYDRLYLEAVSDLGALRHGVQVYNSQALSGQRISRLSHQGSVRPQLVRKDIRAIDATSAVLTVIIRDATYRHYTPMETGITGLIIDARNTRFSPSVYGYLYGVTGDLLFGPHSIDDTHLNRSGMWVYTQTIEAARAMPLMGNNPVVITAEKTTNDNTLVLGVVSETLLSTHPHLLTHNRICVVY